MSTEILRKKAATGSTRKAKNVVRTGERVEKSGIYLTGNRRTPEITLSKGDRVPPVHGKTTKVVFMKGEEKGKVRYTIEFPQKVLDDLNYLAEKEGVTKAEIFRSALALYAYMYKEAKAKGFSLAILDETKNVLREVVFT